MIAAVGAGNINLARNYRYALDNECFSHGYITLERYSNFVDIEKNFNLDPNKIEAEITSRTKAIMVADIFGQSSDIDLIIDIAKNMA